MKIHRPIKGYERQWVLCRTKGCGCVAYYDFVPYSLSNPLMIMPCNHGITERDMGADRITEKRALPLLAKYQAKRERAMRAAGVDLYGALKAFLMHMRPTNVDVRKRVEAALAKAEGRAS